ncbi:MAG TPA: hypothetical protein VEK07_12680 [Polyangiaceae bacterium]|nr:hypothetical protein [Polyangiaceae bacterium]
MGIDRIGKGAPAAPAPPSTVSPTEQVERAPSDVGRPFESGVGIAVKDPSAVDGAPNTALQRLQAGTLTLEGYLDHKVDEATAQLALPKVELTAIRAALRERLASDPTLANLVRSATGAVASPPDDE